MCWRSSIKDSLQWLKHPHFTLDVGLEAACAEGLIRELGTVQRSICGLLWKASAPSLTSHPSTRAPTTSGPVLWDRRWDDSCQNPGPASEVHPDAIALFPHLKMRTGISSYNEKNVWKSPSSPPGTRVVITSPRPLFALWANREHNGNNQKQKGRLTQRVRAGPGWERGGNRGERIKDKARNKPRGTVVRERSQGGAWRGKEERRRSKKETGQPGQLEVALPSFNPDPRGAWKPAEPPWELGLSQPRGPEHTYPR